MSASTVAAAGPVLELADVTKHFPVRRGLLGRAVASVKAVDGVSFSVGQRETVGLVGESGCGKSTLARLAVRLVQPTSGQIVLNGEDITAHSPRQMRVYRQHVQIIFQDPYSALNPRMTAASIVREPLDNFRIGSPLQRRERVSYLLDRVGLNRDHFDKYPSEFSGGQRQRLGIARALATEPRLIVCDEAVAALDVSVRAQIINLLQDLQGDFGLSYLFISHDIAVIQHMSRRVVVMYLGKAVEIADASALFRQALHPYTQALFASVLSPSPATGRIKPGVRGDVPSPINPPSGCRFRTRCPMAIARCAAEEPPLRQVGIGHHVSCHLVG